MGRRTRVALVATHPIQYHVPWFQRLAAQPDIELIVFFGMLPDAKQQGVGFGVGFQWDIPLREGYASEVLDNVSRHPSLGVFSGCDTPSVRRRMRAWSPDAVILTGWQSKMLMQAWWAAVRLGIPRVIRGESNLLHPRPAWKRGALRAWLHGFDQFLAIGKANRAFYLAVGVPPARIHGCPYFVDNQRFAVGAASVAERRMQLRRDWNIPSESACFLFCGKLIDKKRPFDLLHALRLAVTAGASVHALIVGTGELEQEMRRVATSEGLPVTFAGFLNQTEIVNAYVAADCLVLPSDSGETWGLVVNEAMACSLPALVSDQVGCAPDLAIDGVTGSTFALGDVARLADLMVRMAADPAGRAAMGVRARNLVISNYSVERATEGTLAALTAALDSG